MRSIRISHQHRVAAIAGPIRVWFAANVEALLRWRRPQALVCPMAL